MLLLALALAQDGSDEALPEEEAGMEILVESDRSVAGARAALDQAIREEGYLPGVDLGNRTFYYPQQFWEPRVTVYDAGFVRVKARVVSPFPLWPMVGVWSHPHVVEQAEARVLQDIQPELSEYRSALIARGLALRREELRAELELIGLLPTEQATAEATTLWLETADTPEGEAVRRLIEAWYEDHLPPLSDEQLATLNEAREFPRPWLPQQLGEVFFLEDPGPDFDFLYSEEEEREHAPKLQGEGLDRDIQALPAPSKKPGVLDRLNGD